MEVKLRLASRSPNQALSLELKNTGTDPISFNQERFLRNGGRTDLLLLDQNGHPLEADEFTTVNKKDEDQLTTVAPNSTLTLTIPIEIVSGKAFSIVRLLGAGYRVERGETVYARLTWPEAAELAGVPIKVM